QHLDALDALRAAIVGDVQVRLHLDHRSNSFSSLRPGQARRSVAPAQPCADSAPASAAVEAASSAFPARPFPGAPVAGVARVSTRPSTVQVFSLESGRVSSMRTVSPALYSFRSS